jgi:iron complex transport system ATP-binding protein
VLHDLALGARYADRLIGIARGGIAFDGPPADVLEAGLLSDVFGLPMDVLTDPSTGRLVPVPR